MRCQVDRARYELKRNGWRLKGVVSRRRGGGQVDKIDNDFVTSLNIVFVRLEVGHEDTTMPAVASGFQLDRAFR